MEEIKTKIAHAERILKEQFGIPEWNRRDPLDELIVTLLSQNTNDKNRDRAYWSLRERFPDWRAVMDADVADVEGAIRMAGLSKQKSVRMQNILKWIQETFGVLTLQPLQDMTDDDAIQLLTTQKGIGIKTAAVTLAFSMDRDLCPVDTHVHRIAKRFGWVDPKANAEKTFYTLRPLIPQCKAQTFHLNLLKFGRTICTARRPDCDNCPLRSDCVIML